MVLAHAEAMLVKENGLGYRAIDLPLTGMEIKQDSINNPLDLGDGSL